MAKARDLPKVDEELVEQMEDQLAGQELEDVLDQQLMEPEPEPEPLVLELDANGYPMGPYSKQFPIDMPKSDIKKHRDQMARYPVATAAMPTGTDPLNREPLSESMLNEFASSYTIPLGYIRSLRFTDQGGTLLQLDHRGNGRYELRMVGE
jgi:hypothetical protein